MFDAFSRARFSVAYLSKHRWWMWFFMGLATGVLFLTYRVPANLVAFHASVLMTFASCQDGDKTLRLWMMVGATAWLTNILISSPTAVRLEMCFLGSNLFGFWRCMAINFLNLLELSGKLFGRDGIQETWERIRLPRAQEFLLETLTGHVKDIALPTGHAPKWPRDRASDTSYLNGWHRRSLSNHRPEASMGLSVTYRLFTPDLEFRIWQDLNGYGLSIRARAEEAPALNMHPSAIAKNLFAQLKFAEGIPDFVTLRA